MASALQKLFRKRISKQQIQEQRQKQEAEAEAARKASKAASSPRKETQPYLTVSSLNSPSASSLHFPFSSKVSLSSYPAQIDEDESFSASPSRQGDRLSRQDSNSSYHNNRPRAASLSAASMMRDLSDGSERRRVSHYHDTDTLLDQFGTLIESDADRVTQGLIGGEEDELDQNPLYAALTHRSSLRNDWNMAKLVLVPSRAQIIGHHDMNNDAYVALHALSPSNLYKDQYISVRCTLPSSVKTDSEDSWSNLKVTATISADSRSVQIVIAQAGSTDGPRLEHSAKVISETTVYRSMTTQEYGHNLPPTPATQGQKRTRRERVRIRILTIEDLVIPSDALSRLHPIGLPGGMVRAGIEHSFQTQLETQRQNLSKDGIAFPQSSPTLKSPPSPHTTISPNTDALATFLDATSIPQRRQFLADFVFLLDSPEEMRPLRTSLHAALDTLIKAANEFTSAYVYVSGFDAYNVSRIRRGILSKAWQTFETSAEEADVARLGLDGRASLLLLLENVVMGHCHGKIYSSIRAVYRTADEVVDNVICTYQELQVSLEDLGVGFPAICRRPALLDRAIFIAKHLGDPDEDMEHLLADSKVTLIRSLVKQGDFTSSNAANDLFYYNPERNRGRMRTPLDVFDVLQATLDEIGSALERANKSNIERGGTLRASLGTDELLPVLAYVLIRAGPMKLVSLLYYARQFGLSDAISSQTNWALVTHEAVIEFLRKDPLHFCSVRLPTCSASVHPFSSQSTVFNAVTPRPGGGLSRNNSSDIVRRDRRCSLPSSILLSSVNSDMSDLTLPSSALPSTASTQEGAEDQGATETDFKVPGRPASAYAVAGRSKVISALDAVGEDGMTGSPSSPRPAPPFPRSPSSLSKRTTSMSGDLHIRPQIVVRSTKGSARSPTTSTGSGGRTPFADIIAYQQEPVRNLDRTLSLGSKQMSRTGSEGPPHRRFDQSAVALSMPKHARRKSLDSWASFSFFGSGAVTPTPGDGTATSSSTAEMSPSSSSQGYPATPTSLASSPTMWLSSWTTDWGQRRKNSLPALEHRISSDAGSRPGSITSNEDSIAPLRNYSFSSSSQHSSQYVRPDDLHPPERRRRRPAMRTRLLSTSTPTEPLPPKVYPDTAMGDYFHHEHAFGNISATSTYTPLAASARLHSALAPSIEQQATSQSIDSRDSLSIAPSPSMGKIQIPTPVEEISDPMAAASPM